MKVAIVTDSNSGISLTEAKQLGITIIPMPFLIDDEEYYEEINLTQEEFYNKLTKGSNVSTSQPSIYNVCKVWKTLLKEYDEVLHIPMSSGLSASCETAKSAATEFNGKVHVVDNKRISVTLKRAVYDAINLAKDEKSATEIKDILEETASLSSIYIMVNTLKYLKKGGRVTPAAAAIGTLLKIKPVLTIQGAKLDKFAQVISANIGKKRMLTQIEKELETRFADLLKQNKISIDMAYTNCKEKCLEFKQEADKMLQKYNLEVNLIDPLSLSVACHIGDGAIAITICYKN